MIYSLCNSVSKKIGGCVLAIVPEERFVERWDEYIKEDNKKVNQ